MDNIYVNNLGFHFLGFLACTLVGALACRFSFCRIYVSGDPNQSCWGKWLVFRHDDVRNQWYFSISHDPMTNFRRCYDSMTTFWYAIIVFFISNIPGRFGEVLDLVYLAPLIGVIFLFGFLGEVKHFGEAITNGSIDSLTPAFIITLVISGLALLSLVGWHIYLAVINGFVWWYLALIIGLPLIYLSLFYFIQKEDKKPRWHLHHWFTGFFFSLAFNGNHPVAKVAFSVMYAIFLHGAVAYGTAPIVYSDYDSV